jgi:cellobiose phosphorylase
MAMVLTYAEIAEQSPLNRSVLPEDGFAQPTSAARRSTCCEYEPQEYSQRRFRVNRRPQRRSTTVFLSGGVKDSVCEIELTEQGAELNLTESAFSAIFILQSSIIFTSEVARKSMSTFVSTQNQQASDANPSTLSRCAYGFFKENGGEYVITDPKTPRPWSNIIANERIGLAVSQTGSGFTWVDNSQLAVITRWNQDLTEDNSGKFLYLRDVETGEVWSLTPAPTWRSFDHYECRHGLGYTTFDLSHAGIHSEWTLFCHARDPLELWRVAFHNQSDRVRKLELISFFEWNCGVAPSPRREFTKLFVENRYDAQRGVIYARSRMWDVPSKNHGHWNTDFPYTSAFGCNRPVSRAEGDKLAFLGRYGNLKQAVALTQDKWPGRFGSHHDAIAALAIPLEIEPGETLRADFALAIAQQDEDVDAMLQAALPPEQIDAALAEAKDSWKQRLAAHRVETPDPSIDLLANDWLRYQTIVGRMWGRCGYYQQSGAFGYRDQLQDSQVWLTIDPARCREQINLHAQHQFADGSVYHWWHPLSEQGLITTMTDDLLWLAWSPRATCARPGISQSWTICQPFLDDANAAPLREHVSRAFARVFTRTSPRGLPYIGAGDWNDGLSACGLQEKGESVWLGHFLAGLLADWAHIHAQQGDSATADDYRSRRDALVNALNTTGWDGDWYLRATLDDGSKLGSASCSAGKIFLNAQTWAILNDVADGPRARQCWSAVREHLVSEVGALLLAPAFSEPDEKVGYITRYAPGLRENGGVYTHAATWAIAAAAKMRDSVTLAKLLDAINPTNKDPERYWAEPYVTPGNVDGPLSPYFGRGGWTWYTGSAAWLHRVICEWVLGVRPTWDGLLIDPVLPPGWEEVSLTRPYRGATLQISMRREASLSPDASPSIKLNGEPIRGSVIAPSSIKGKTAQIEVQLPPAS